MYTSVLDRARGRYLGRVTIDPTRLRQRLDTLFGIDPRALAALRIAMGLLILVDLITRLPFLTLFYTDDGLLPRWLAVGMDPLSRWSLHALGGSQTATLGLFALAGLFAIMLLVGYRTWLATFASWALLGSLQLRNPYILDGGDYVLRVLLFWSLFVPLNRCWSVDARRALTGPPVSPTVLSVGTAAIFLQIGLIYFFAGAIKVLGSEWRDGTAVYWVANHEYWARPLAAWISTLPTLVLHVFTYGVLALEIVGSLLLFAPMWTHRFRMLAVGLFLLFHLATGLSIELGLFPLISSAGLILFVPARWWDRFASLRLPSQSPLPSSDHAVRHHRWPARLRSGVVAIALTFTVVANVETMRRYWIFPNRVRRVAVVLGVGQGWGMYAPSPYNEGFRVEIRGTRADGSDFLIDGGGQGARWAPVARMQDGYRPKIYLEWIATGGWDVAVHHFAHWVCRQQATAPGAGNATRVVTVAKLVNAESPAIPTVGSSEITLSSLVCGSD